MKLKSASYSLTLVLLFEAFNASARNKPIATRHAEVNVDASTRTSKISPLIYGLNVARWDEDLFPGPAKDMLLTADRDAIRKIRDAGFTILKYPGGNDADHYIWNNPDNSAAEMNTDEYAALLEATGAEGFITINFNESPELAAEWVRYCNKIKDYGIKYWEIGDEQWGAWARGHTTPEKYAERFVSFARAMKQADPTIKVAANVMPSADTSDWTYRLVKIAGKEIDFVTFSYYPFTNKEEFDDSILTGAARYRVAYDAIRQALEKAMPLADPVHGKEKADTMWIADVGYNSISGFPGPITLSMANTLYIADVVGTMAELGEKISCYWALHNSYPPRGGDYGIMSDDGRNKINPSYYVFPLFTRLFGRDLVKSSSSDSAVAAYSSLSGEDSLSVILINKKKSSAADVSIRIDAFEPKETASVWLLDADHRLTSLHDLHCTDGAFKVKVPPYSIVVLRILKKGFVPLPPNLAFGAHATASSCAANGPDFGPAMAVDGKTYTRWASAGNWGTEKGLDRQWLELDLRKPLVFDEIVIRWAEGHGIRFNILSSNDGKRWSKIIQVENGSGGIQKFDFNRIRSRYVKLVGIEGTRGVSTYSICEFEIYDSPRLPDHPAAH